ncbi:MAG TPA: chromosome segregation protein SMC, partial [Planctomycetota bacterium]|nr:chromosome segregation protein SMC [Planctomycetota bacterium]
MRLEQVEISGFKSFCDRQEISFKGGVTGIVGPNGCGKSNISDAISWVLGEQSAKSLRGASMEDVIFSGSQSRQAVGMAEVNLKVSGLNGNSPDGNPECVVTRRLYRNGESEYLMNGEVCRLKDIHELFMDTGLGSKAYSIIEQGKIGQILSGKPADRRALIEEAAGITKYRARRRQTQLKLEAAQQNLLRVNDIVHEVEKQLESLKRQAGKARRYRAVREEMQGLERIVFGRRFVDLRAQAESLALRIGAEGEREQAATIALESEEAQMEVRRTVLHDDEGLLQDVRTRLNELTLAVDRHQGRSGYCREQIAETEARAAEARGEASELDARVGPLAEHLAGRQSEETRLRAELATAGEEARASEAAVHEIAGAQARAEAELESAREAQVTVLSQLASLGNARESVSGNAERAAADLLKLAAEMDDLERESVRVAEMHDGAQRRQEESDALAARLSAQRADALSRAAASREATETLDREADAAQSERDGLAGRLSSLEEIVATHAAFDEGVRALLAGPNGIEVLGVVADSVETDSQYERAVEALLGDRLQAVLVPDAAHAVRGIAWLEESGAGRGAFLPLASARKRLECSTLRDVARVEPGVRGLLADVFRVSGPHADAIRGSLPDAIVVETLDQALELVARRGSVSCVTLAGETLRGSMVEGGRAVKGLLAPRREIKEVQARLAALEEFLAGLRLRAQEHAAAADLAAAEARALEEQIHGAEKDL